VQLGRRFLTLLNASSFSPVAVAHGIAMCTLRPLDDDGRRWITDRGRGLPVEAVVVGRIGHDVSMRTALMRSTRHAHRIDAGGVCPGFPRGCLGRTSSADACVATSPGPDQYSSLRSRRHHFCPVVFGLGVPASRPRESGARLPNPNWYA